LNLYGKTKKNLAQTRKKAGNRHEKIPSVAYSHSVKRSFNYICISGISRLMKASNCRKCVRKVLIFVE